MKIQLNDNLTNSSVDVVKNPSYSFTVNMNKPATFGSGRFSLTFSKASSNVPLTVQISASCDASLASIKVTGSSLDYDYTLLSSVDGSEVVAAIAGTGNDLNIQIPGNKLVQGLNTFQVKQV